MKMQAKKVARNKTIIEMYMGGYSILKIACVLKLSKGIVTQVIWHYAKDQTGRQPLEYKFNMESDKCEPARKRTRKNGSAESEEKIRIAKEMRAQGYTYAAIGKALNMSRQRAHQLANDYN